VSKKTKADAASDATFEDFVDDLRTLVSDAEELLRATEGQASEKVAEIRARAEASLGSAKERLKQAGAGIEDRARSAASSTDAYVRENPWTAVAVGVGVGYLLGLLARRR
jgi:ElaB/YqjD/DUF883 family membrane-anchored ribosome-binding protein